MTWLEWLDYEAGAHRAKLKQWEHTRQISWILYKANTDPDTAAKDMLNWWPLPTDGPRAVPKTVKGKRISKAQLQDFFNDMK